MRRKYLIYYFRSCDREKVCGANLHLFVWVLQHSAEKSGRYREDQFHFAFSCTDREKSKSYILVGCCLYYMYIYCIQRGCPAVNLEDLGFAINATTAPTLWGPQFAAATGIEEKVFQVAHCWFMSAKFICSKHNPLFIDPINSTASKKGHILLKQRSIQEK